MMFAFARRFLRPGRKTLAPARTRSARLNCDSLEGREVPATGLGIANDFGAFVLHDLNAFTSDVQGRVAAGGNATITAYGLGDHLYNSTRTRDDLIVGGNLNFTNGQVFYGNIVHGGTGTFDHFGHPNGSIRQGTVLDFGAAGTELRGLSDSYAALAATGTVENRWGTIVLTGTRSGQNVFKVPASMLWHAYDLRINTPAGSSALVNITGADARMQFMGFHLEGGVAKENVILNFPQAATLTLQGIGIFGNVLAPRANVAFSNGQLNGTLVAGSWSGYGQVNQEQQQAPPPPPPSPQNPPAPPDTGCPPACNESKVSGLVYFDQDRDGVAQDSEPRLEGVSVSLTGTDAGGNQVSRQATTDAGGIYEFAGLPAGTYAIEVTTPAGYTPGQSSTGAFGGIPAGNLITNVDVRRCDSSGAYNFGERKPEPPPPVPAAPVPCDCGCPPVPCGGSKVSGLVYFDRNADGVAQDFEMRLQGVVVTLTGTTTAGVQVSLQTTTDAGGIYEFSGLAAGTYTITVQTPAGYTHGQSSTGAFGGQTGCDTISGIDIAECQSSGAYNFGEITGGP